MNHYLMENNITKEDRSRLISFLRKDNYLTSGKKVRDFEKVWSKWLGVKYSVFVNSGSSANLLSLSYLKTIHKKGEIIVSTLNWVSDITSIIYNNFKPIFVDINLENLGAKKEEIKKKINKNTVGIFLTHILGFNALDKEIIKICKKKNIFLIEDVCESHGASYLNKKLGTFGQISNFSFYYAHHMTTIEGGMVCTNKREIYEVLRMMRGHGMLRESTNKKLIKSITKKNSNLNKQFIFAYPGYNFRSTELNAVIGINQIKKLNSNNKKRIKNFNIFINHLNNDKYFTNFNTNGSCNYALVVIFKKKFRNLIFRKRFENILKKNNIEFRRGTSGGGNQIRQPYLKHLRKKLKLYPKKFVNTEIVHHYGYYIGNYPTLSKSKIIKICNILNNV